MLGARPAARTGRPPAGRHLLLGLFTVLAALFIVSPLIIVILNSFNSVAYNVFPPSGLSLRWYLNLASQSAFYAAGLRSILLALSSSLVALAVGTMASYALVRYRLPGLDWVKAFFLSPIVLPKMVLGVALFMFFVRVGAYGSWPSLILTHALVSLPFVVAIMTASLAGFDWTLEEAAQDLGARPLLTFFRIVLPQISTSLVVCALFSFITSFDQVETTIFLTRPENTTLPIEMFLYMQKWQDPTIAALSAVLIAFSVLLVAAVGVALRRVDVTSALAPARKESANASE